MSSDSETNDSETNDEDEYPYGDFGNKIVYKLIINVAGGGLGNGNTYANIEAEFRNLEDLNNRENAKYYYCEYGSNPIRRYEGEYIQYNEEGYCFKVY